MMAGLFALFGAGFMAIVFGYRLTAIFFWVIGTALSGLMFWHHATDSLKILW
jgi:hypothetical protein